MSHSLSNWCDCLMSAVKPHITKVKILKYLAFKLLEFSSDSVHLPSSSYATGMDYITIVSS